MHWKIATAVRDQNAADNSAFTFNACMREGAGTQALKKVTCKVCKPLIEQPRTPEQVAAVLYQRVLSETTDAVWVTLGCNACDCEPVDTQEFTYEAQWVSIGKIVRLLGHVAYDHAVGSEVIVSRHECVFSVYQLNLALGKQPLNNHEDAWRQRVLSEAS